MQYGRCRFLINGVGYKAAMLVILVGSPLSKVALAQFKMPDQKTARAHIHAPLTSGSAMLKGNGAGGFSNAVAGTDYQGPISDNSLNSHNFANRINAGGTLLGAQPACSDLTGAAAHCGTDAGELISGTVPAAQMPPNFTAQTVSSSSANPARHGLLNDINNHTSVAASDAANDGNDIAEIGTDASNVVHVGGGGASAISLDNSTSVNQGQFSSGAYLDFPATNPNWSGGVENCAQKWHIYTIGANATLMLSCTSTSNQTLDYLIYQPKSGSTFSYSFGGANGTTLFGVSPTACSVNGCVDYIEVTWVPSHNDYIITQLHSSLTQISACPLGQTCYYFSSSSGNDSTGAGTQASPWQSISKAMSILSTLQPGDRELFKGGDTWTASAKNPAFILGDTAAHAVNGSSAKPILISTYGTGRAIIDAANTNAQCFAEINPANGNPPPTSNPVQYLTISNFECEHAYSQGMVFIPNGSVSPGMTVSNNYIHNTGHGCSTSSSACGPAQEDPSNWQASHTYTANSSSVDGIIKPSNNNSGAYWFMETVASCTSGSSAPLFPQTAGATVSDGPGSPTPACSWTNTGVKGVYKNQLQDFSSGSGGTNGFHFLNNIVKWCGGHNCVQVDGDTGGVLIQANTVGPGCVHGCIDVKESGDSTASPATVVQVLGNTVTCGYSLGLCGCQNSNSLTCSSNATPALYTTNTLTSIHHDIMYQLNTVYDSTQGFQDCPSSSVNDCATSSNTCPVIAKYYNNTVYLPTSQNYMHEIGTTCGNGRFANSTIDVRNNIFDGGSTSIDVPTGSTTNWASTMEDYNDVGGAQGSSGFTFNGTSTKGAHDFCASGCSRGSVTDPKYVAAGASPPNFGLQTGSPCLSAGLIGLTSGNTNIGAY